MDAANALSAWIVAHEPAINVVASVVTALAGIAVTAIAYLWTRRQARVETLGRLREGLQTFQLNALQDEELLRFIAKVQAPEAGDAAQAAAAETLRKAYFYYAVLNIQRLAFEARRAGVVGRSEMAGSLRGFCETYAHDRDFLRRAVLPQYPKAFVAEIERHWRAAESRARR